MSARKTKDERSFGEARARLDEILDELEGDAGDVDRLAARVKEASELIRFCRERLSAARHEVTEVVAELARQTDEVAAEDEGPEGDSDEDASQDAPSGSVDDLPF